jgi:hypothetical protein
LEIPASGTPRSVPLPTFHFPESNQKKKKKKKIFLDESERRIAQPEKKSNKGAFKSPSNPTPPSRKKK